MLVSGECPTVSSRARGERVRLACLALVMALLPAAPATARDVHVDAALGSDSTGDGSAALPFRSISRALSLPPVSGDHLRVAAGEYSATATGEVLPLDLPEGVSLHGTSTTTIRGEAPGPVIRATTGSPLGTFWLIEDLVLEGPGEATATTGILLVPGRGQGPVVQRALVRGFGRGIASEIRLVSAPEQQLDSRAFVDACRLESNGTGLLVSVSMQATTGRVRERSEVANTVFIGNGTGLRIHADCSGCDRDGLDLGNPIHNNTFLGNTGDAIVLESNDCTGTAVNSPDLTNNAVVASGGRGYVADACVDPNPIETNDFWANAGGGNGPFPGWPTNISVDPLFVDAASGDAHLRPGSPLIDAGSLAEPLTDFEGDTRPLDGDLDQTAAFDIGADEHNPSLRLLRGVLASVAPPSPPLRSFFPFDASNPFTPVLLAVLAPGAVDPTPGILDDPRYPMALYQHDGDPALVLLASKRFPARTLAFDLR